VTPGNVWALFGGQGYSYNNLAVRSAYWPRLYGLGLPDGQFEAVTAAGEPGTVGPEGAFHTAMVRMRTDLHWSDGVLFTARDVAFTINTALRFELGFDWRDYHDPRWLDHAEAASADTVKFFFKRPPGIGQWQYGALQAPVVQEAFWAPKVATASELLPPEGPRAEKEAASARISLLQPEVNALYAAGFSATGEQRRELQAELKRKQGNLDEATNDLAEAQAALADGMDRARQSLFAQEDVGEPVLGAWLPADPSSADSGAPPFVNVPNPAFPAPVPNFDRFTYRLYDDGETAAKALNEGEVDVILDPSAASPAASENGRGNPARSLRFLVFNLDSPALSREPIRQALACLLDQDRLAGLLGNATALTSYVSPLPGPWAAEAASLPCSDLDQSARLVRAVEILRAAGYTWDQSPTTSAAGSGLRFPDAAAVPALQILAPASDPLRAAAASYVQQQGQQLGLPLTAVPVSADVVDYAVLSSRDFDLAILGWKVAAFPAHLCQWFEAGGQFEAGTGRLASVCGELAVNSQLDRAQAKFAELQEVLAEELPMVPLYAVTVFDQTRAVKYPFDSLLDGLVGAYGAPQFAIPDGP
jgi:ABC-type transport system substrate-binding protein